MNNAVLTVAAHADIKELSASYAIGSAHRGLVSADAVASALDVSRHWVYRAVKQLGMPCHKVGRYIRFDLEDVLTWIREGGAEIN